MELNDNPFILNDNPFTADGTDKNKDRLIDDTLYKYKLGYCLKNEKFNTFAGFDKYDDMKIFIQNLNQEELSYSIWNYKGDRVEDFPIIDYSKIIPKAHCYWCFESHHLEDIITIPEEDLSVEPETYCKTCCEIEELKIYLENTKIAKSV